VSPDFLRLSEDDANASELNDLAAAIRMFWLQLRATVSTD